MIILCLLAVISIGLFVYAFFGVNPQDKLSDKGASKENADLDTSLERLEEKLIKNKKI